MNKENFKLFLGKTIRIAIGFDNTPETFFYTGHIVEIDEDSILFRDKYDHLMSFSMESVQKLEEMGEKID